MFRGLCETSKKSEESEGLIPRAFSMLPPSTARRCGPSHLVEGRVDARQG